MQSVKFKGHPKAEAKRKELLKNLKHNISSYGRYSLKVADALKELGMFHETCGQCDISLTLYQESLDVYSSKLGDHDSNVTDLQMRLGRVNEKLGNENEALQWYALALHMIVDMSAKNESFSVVALLGICHSLCPCCNAGCKQDGIVDVSEDHLKEGGVGCCSKV
jgi:tetratricopeptide (TPR) repeat protein